MRKLIFIVLLILNLSKAIGQINLVPNSGFESFYDFSGCPIDLAQYATLFDWLPSRGTPDYYNECGTWPASAPLGWGGGEIPHSGNGYVGIALYSNAQLTMPWFTNYAEYIGCYLKDTLKAGRKYDLVFYISMMDSAWIATKSIGAYFNKTTWHYYDINPNTGYPMYDIGYYKSLVPQVKYSGQEYLYNKVGWTKIEESFIAEGGEQTMLLGNFDDFSLMDTIYIGGGYQYYSQDTSFNDFLMAYYYIDDVSLVEDTTYRPSGLEEEQLNLIQVGYANGSIQLNGIVFKNRATQLIISTVEGKEVFSKALPTGNSQQNIPANGLPPNVYLYSIVVNGGVVKQGKLVVGE